jgi:EmrB/QacA subfamily drug resistance transporter
MSADAAKTRRPLVLASIMLAMFMVAIEATIVATAMPDIVGRLGGFSLYSWVFSAFLLTQAATTVMFGKLSDLYGRRPILIIGIVVFLLGSTLCGFSWSMPSLIAFRLLQGLGAGAIQPVAMTIIGDLYSAEERAGVQGYLASVWGISAVIGPLVGGLIVERFSWPWVFWINLPVGVATVFMLLRYLHEGVERKRHSIDYAGAAMFFIAISSLLIALTQVGDATGPSAATAVYLLIFVVTIPIFLWHEKRAKEPMLALDLWTDRLIASANAASMVSGMTLIGITGFLAVYVQGVMGRSATVAGLALTMMALGWPIASTLANRFYRSLGVRATLRLGCVLIAIGAAVFPFLRPTTSPIVAGAGSFITGFGMGLLVMTCVILIQNSVGWSQRGSATASNVFARTIGNTLGAAILGSILNLGIRSYADPSGQRVSAEQMRGLLEQRASDGAPNNPLLVSALHHGLHLTFLCLAGFAILTLILALFIPARELKEAAGDSAA